LRSFEDDDEDKSLLSKVSEIRGEISLLVVEDLGVVAVRGVDTFFLLFLELDPAFGDGSIDLGVEGKNSPPPPLGEKGSNVEEDDVDDKLRVGRGNGGALSISSKKEARWG